MTRQFDAAIRKRMHDIEKIVVEAERSNIVAAKQIAEEGANRVKNLLSQDGSYKVTKYSWGEHYSSAPGEAPAKGRGTLLKSIVHGEQNQSNPAVTYFGSNVQYSIYLEFGHGGPRPAAPRPFMRKVAYDPNFHQFIAQTTSRKWMASVRRAAGRYKKVSVNP